MSTIIMSLCWPLPMPPTAKAVLISIADQANDQGVCWPSLPGICERTCFGRTAVIEAVQWLETNGFFVVEKAGGRNNRYVLNLTKLRQRDLGAELESYAQPVRQANRYAKRTGTGGGPTSSPRGPLPVRQADLPVRQTDPNRKEPSGKPSTTTRPRPAGADVSVLGVDDLTAEGIDRQHAVDWLRVRKEKRQPLTPTAWADFKAEAEKAGVAVGDAVRVAAGKGWAKLEAGWLVGDALIAAEPWYESVKGVVAKGVELGLGPWSQAEWEADRQPDYLTYRARVYKAAGIEPRRAA